MPDMKRVSEAIERAARENKERRAQVARFKRQLAATAARLPQGDLARRRHPQVVHDWLIREREARPRRAEAPTACSPAWCRSRRAIPR